MIKKLIKFLNKVLGMPYKIMLWTLKKVYTVLNKLTEFLAYGLQFIIELILRTINTLWKTAKAPIVWTLYKLKNIKPKAVIVWIVDILKESVAQIFTLLGFFIAWFTLTGTAQDIVGIAIVVSIIIWLLTIRWRE
jgi:hypothetical protein